MRTTLGWILIAGISAAHYGVVAADPGLRGLIQIEEVPYYSQPSVEIWTDRDWYAVGDPVRVTVTLDRPGFVTVYNVDAEGCVRRLTDDPRGIWVTPGRPLSLPRRAYARLVATGPGGVEELVAVASPVQFARCDLPFYEDAPEWNLPRCAGDREEFVRNINTCLVGRRECGRQSVARTTFWIEPLWSPVYPIRIGGGLYIDIGFHIPVGALIYVDGAYCGRGPSALSAQRSGKHRVSVLTEAGHKITRTVDFDKARRYRADVTADGKSRGAVPRYERTKRR